MKQNFKWLLALVAMVASINLMAAITSPWTHTFASGNITTSVQASKSLSNINWAIDAATYAGFDDAKGAQIGSGSKPQKSDWTMSTPISSFGANVKITSVSINISTASSGGITYKIEVGDKSKTESLGATTSVTPKTLDNISVSSGNIKITLNSNDKSKAIYIKSITVNFEESTDPSGPTLESIYFTNDAATKLSYTEGDVFDPAGLVVMGKYSEGENKPVTDDVEWSFSPETLATTTTSVTVTAHIDDVDDVQKIVNGITVASAPKFTKVTANKTDWSGEYLLVYENNSTAYVWTGVDAANCNATATISNNQITKPADAVSLTIASMDGGYSILVNGGDNNGKYIYGTSGSNKINFGTDASLNTITYPYADDNNSVKIVSNTATMRYNNASNNNRFRYFGSAGQQNIQLYEKVLAPVSSAVNFSAPEGGSLVIKNGATPITTGATIQNGTILDVTFGMNTPEAYKDVAIKVTKTNGGDDVTSTVYNSETKKITMPRYAITVAVTFTKLYKISLVNAGEGTGTATMNGVTTDIYVDGETQIDLVASAVAPNEFTSWSATENILINEDDKAETYAFASGDGTITATFDVSALLPLDAPTLSAPTNITYNSVTLNWQELDNAVAYNVELLLNDETVASDVIFGETSWTPEVALQVNTTYTYTVQGIGDGITYAEENNPKAQSTVKTADYPTIEVTYSENGNTEHKVNQKLFTEFNLPTTARKASKTFVGWSKNSDCTTAPEYNPGDEITLEESDVEENKITFYAVYATESEGDKYFEKVSSAPADWCGKYLIVYETGKLAMDGSLETLDAVGNSTSVTISDSKIAWSQDMEDISFTIAYKTGSSTVYSLKSASGKYISGTTTSAKAANGLKQADTDADYEISFSGIELQSKSSDKQMVLKYNKSEGQTRFRFYSSGQEAIAMYKYSATISYSDYTTTCKDKVATPVLTTGGIFAQEQSVIITCETEGATIYYTTDGKTPTSGSEQYTGAISVSERGKTTITAIAIKADMDNSDVASADYIINKPFASVSELIGYVTDKELTTLSDVTVTGVVSEIVTEYSSDYKNVSFNISDNGKTDETQLEGFRTKGDKADVVAVGDKVTLKGNYKLFNSIHELDADNTITEYTAKDLSSVTVGGTAAKTEYISGETFDYAGLTATANYSNTGYSVDVTDDVTWENDLTDSKVTENTTVQVTAKYNSKSSDPFDVTVTVSSKTLTKIELDKDYFEVYVGQALPKPIVTATYSEGDPTNVSDVAKYDTENKYDKTTAGTYTITVAYTFGTTMSKTYTVKVKDYANDAENPYSVSEALTIITEVIGKNKSEKNIIVTGTVNAEVIASGKYGRYKITDGEKELTVYDGKAFGDESFTKTNYPQKGDVVLVEGKVINYNETTPEFATGESHLLSWTRPATLEIADVDNHEVGLPDLAEADLTITKNSTARVAFTSSDNESAVTIVDNKLHAVATGSATITANIAATENENALNYTAASTTFKVTVIASQQRYSVTIDGNGADGGEAPEPIADQLEKAQVTLPVNTYTRTNHKFTGWVVTNNTTTAIIDQNEGTFVMPASAVTITAQWEAKQTFNNGVWVKVASTDELNKTDFYIIASGYDSYNYAMKMYVDDDKNCKSEEITKSDNLLFYTTQPAIFRLEDGKNANQYAIRDIDSELPYLYAASSTANQLKAQKTKDDDMASWKISVTEGTASIVAASSNRNTMSFNNSNNPKIFSCYSAIQSNGQLALYKYVEGAYAISFDANGGTGAPEALITNGGKAILPTTIPTKQGFEFAGWYDNIDFIGSPYATGVELTFTKNTTLYAKWNTLIAHHITYVSGGAAGEIPVDAEDYYKGDDVKLKSADKLSNPGHNFAGWQVSYNDGEKQIISVVDNQFTMPDYDVTATAQWALRTNDKWVLVTSVEQLKTGEKYVIANNENDAVAGDITGSNTYMNKVSATFSDNKQFITAMAGQVELTLGGSTDAWTFAKDASNYLTNSGTSLSWSTTASTWKIAFEDDKMTIVEGENNSLQYNTSSPRFKTYTSSQAAVQLYVLVPAQAINEEVNASTLQEHADVTINEGGNLIINESKELGDLYVMAGGKVTIQEGKTLAVKNFVIKSEMGGGKSGQVIGVIENNFSIQGNAYFDVTMDKCAEGSTIADQWHAFAVPFKVDAINGIYDLDDKKLTNEVNYAIMDYHGDVRATGAYGWKKFRGIMNPGTFYLMTVDGERTTYRMKMASAFEVASNEIAVSAYASSETADAGWNGIANSQLEYVTIAKNVQVLNPTSYTYEVMTASEYNFTVGTPFFYQANGEEEDGKITLAAANSDKPAYAPRMTAEAKNIAITFANESYTDRLYISATDEATDEYQIGRDLVKMTMTNTPVVPQIFAEAYGTKLCMVDAPMMYDEAVYALNLYAPANGEYTIGAAQVDGYEVFLTQYGSVIWNLSMSEATIELTKGNNTEYGLILKATGAHAPTDINTRKAQQSVQKFLYNSNIYIRHNNKTFNVQGQLVK